MRNDYQESSVARCLNAMALCRFYMTQYKRDPVLVEMFRKQYREWRNMIPYYRNMERRKNRRSVVFWS